MSNRTLITKCPVVFMSRTVDLILFQRNQFGTGDISLCIF